MSDHSLAKMLEEARQNSEEFAQRSTKLSEFLEWFQVQFKSLSGQTAVSVKGSSGYKLEFTRMGGQGWVLIITAKNGNNFYPVVSASVDKKIEAVKLAKPLLVQLLKVQKEKLETLDNGLSTANTILSEWKEGV